MNHLQVSSGLSGLTGIGLGRWRWVGERTFAWLHNVRRLRLRRERHADIHDAFLTLGCALICWRRLVA
jgi:transposase